MAVPTLANPCKHGHGRVMHGLHNIRARIAAAEYDAGRAPGAVTLVAISKTFAADAIAPVLEAGQRVFGENRVQEAQAKWPAVRGRFPDIELHLVGPLQTNKAADAVALFDCIESLDRPKLIAVLAREYARQGRRPKLFVQINTGAEPQKAGAPVAEADRFIEQCRAQFGDVVAGLMCIPPEADDPRPHFELLAAIAARHGLAGLSMGMSADFEIAIGCGATHVRIGSAIFGDRSRNQ